MQREYLSQVYCYRPEHLIFHRHFLRSNISLDLANLLQVGFDAGKVVSPGYGNCATGLCGLETVKIDARCTVIASRQTT